MPSSRNSPKVPKKKPPAKKQWKAAPSKPSATSATKLKKPSLELESSLALLKEHYPDAHCELEHRNPFELLVATILSAQCTDVRVNMVTPKLFEEYPDAPAMAAAPLSELERLIGSINFFRNKAKSLQGMAKSLVEKHGGEVPRTAAELTQLAGVGSKTANVVLGNAFNIASGVVVDTHVMRLSQRFGWTQLKEPVKIAPVLEEMFEREEWIQLPHLLIFHGRRVCKARTPLCKTCFLVDRCPRIGVE